MRLRLQATGRRRAGGSAAVSRVAGFHVRGAQASFRTVLLPQASSLTPQAYFPRSCAFLFVPGFFVALTLLGRVPGSTGPRWGHRSRARPYRPHARRSTVTAPAPERLDPGRQALGVGTGVDVPHPHDQRVAAVRVVVRPDADGGHAEAPVQGDGRARCRPSTSRVRWARATGQRRADQVAGGSRCPGPVPAKPEPRRCCSRGPRRRRHLAGEAHELASPPTPPGRPGRRAGPAPPRTAAWTTARRRRRPRCASTPVRSLGRIAAAPPRVAGSRGAVRIRRPPSLTARRRRVPAPAGPLLPVDLGVGLAAGSRGPGRRARPARLGGEAAGRPAGPGWGGEGEDTRRPGRGRPWSPGQRVEVADGAVPDHEHPAVGYQVEDDQAASSSGESASGGPAHVGGVGRIVRGPAPPTRTAYRGHEHLAPAGRRPRPPPWWPDRTRPGPGPRRPGRRGCVIPRTPIPSAWPSALAVATPTRRPVKSPGPTSTASASMSSRVQPDSADTSSMLGASSSPWACPPMRGCARPPPRRRGSTAAPTRSVADSRARRVTGSPHPHGTPARDDRPVRPAPTAPVPPPGRPNGSSTTCRRRTP